MRTTLVCGRVSHDVHARHTLLHTSERLRRRDPCERLTSGLGVASSEDSVHGEQSHIIAQYEDGLKFR